MQIKVKCVCGSAYTFDDTPVDGRLQFPVNCVNCGADGTAKANAYIAAQLSGTPEPVAPKKGMFSFLKKQKTESADDVTASLNTSIPEPVDDEKRRLVFAICAGLWAGAFGAFGWLGLAKTTGMEFGIAAWFIGGMVGVAIRCFGPRGHQWMGPIGGVAALIAIFGGELLTARWAIKHVTEDFATRSYVQAVNWAEAATQAGNDTELRGPTAVYKVATLIVGDQHGSVLANYQHYQLNESPFVVGHIIDREHAIVVFAKQAEAEKEDNVTEAEVAQFRMKALPELNTLAAGKPTQEEYKATMKKMVASRMSFSSLLLAAMQPLSYVWVFLGVITGYRFAQRV